MKFQYNIYASYKIAPSFDYAFRQFYHLKSLFTRISSKFPVSVSFYHLEFLFVGISSNFPVPFKVFDEIFHLVQSCLIRNHINVNVLKKLISILRTYTLKFVGSVQKCTQKRENIFGKFWHLFCFLKEIKPAFSYCLKSLIT